IHIAFDGFGINLGVTAVGWCKVRKYFSITLSFISLCYSCLATIDQFFATSSDIRLRNLTYRNVQRTTTLADQGAQKQLTRMICLQGSFYVFLIASSRFRRTVRKKIFGCCWTNQIIPASQA
ncbi:unnamed protein product, partial [Adineta steineri]